MTRLRNVGYRHLSLATTVSLGLLACSCGTSPPDLRARQLCQSPSTADQIRDPYGIDYRLTVAGSLTARRAWNSTVGLLKGWPPRSPEGPAAAKQPTNFWKTDPPSRYIAVCYVHGVLTGQRGTVTATRGTFADALIEVRDDHVAYLISANAPGHALRVQVPPHR